MKTFILATIASIGLASAASAADFSVAGQTLSIGGEVDMNYNTGTELFALEVVPSTGFVAYGVDFEVSTTIDILQLNEGDVFQGVEFEAGYTIPTTNVRAYAEIATNSDLEFGDLLVGATLSF